MAALDYQQQLYLWRLQQQAVFDFKTAAREYAWRASREHARGVAAENMRMYRAVARNQWVEAQKQLEGLSYYAQANVIGFGFADTSGNLPTAFRRTTSTQSKQNTQRSVQFMVNASVADTIREVQFKVNEATVQAVGDVGDTFVRTYNNRWRQVLRINQQIAAQAVEDMVDHYDRVYKERQRGKGGRKSTTGYRRDSRYSGGQLRAALSSPLQAQATLDGVIFGNESLLDSTARHWARLSFGAGQRAGQRAGQSGLPLTRTANSKRFSANQAFFADALDLPEVKATLPYGPRGAFWMPAGLWLSEQGNFESNVAPSRGRRGMDAFYTTKEQSVSDLKPGSQRFAPNFSGRKITQGVQAWGFIQAGADSVARNLGPANRDFLLGIMEEAVGQVKTQPTKKIPLATPQRMAAAAALLRTR